MPEPEHRRASTAEPGGSGGSVKGVAEVREEAREKGRREGRVAERVERILWFLERREVDVPADIRARIAACTDLDTLQRWLKRAFAATAVEDLFTDE